MKYEMLVIDRTVTRVSVEAEDLESAKVKAYALWEMGEASFGKQEAFVIPIKNVEMED
jgi:hypothetical protein